MLAAIALLFGAVIGSFFKFSDKSSSLVQHFTAGIIFAAVSIELLPKLLEAHSSFYIALGFALGIALMLVIKSYSDRNESKNQVSIGLLVGVGIDLCVDGFLIAIAFFSGDKAGRLMTLALVLEVTFLALTLSGDFKQKNTTLLFRVLSFCALSLLIPLSTGMGIMLLNVLTPPFLTIALSFGAAALLYLVTEELLAEAHETKDTPLITSSFFVGFLMIFLLQG